jgi:RNA polymerase sigma-70 factor (ECF subfamily)
VTSRFGRDTEDHHADGAKTDIPTSLAFGWTANEDLRRFLVGFPQRFKAINGMRRRARFDSAQKDLALYLEERINEAPQEDEEIEDDRLRLIFTCCHPALPPEGQVALTLREVCGLTTEEIARAFLVPPATLAQRIVRAKAVIRDKAIPYQVPVSQELPARLGAVLQVVYLVFNEGYSAGTTGAELSREAIRVGRLLVDVLPEPEVMGLIGLMLLQESRRAARSSPEGDLILLDQQDRSLWNKDQIAEGISFTESALASRRFGAYTLQAAIAAVHAEASSSASTDWRQITLLYNRLVRIQPSPVVELNRAVAIAMCEGPEQGLRLIDALLAPNKRVRRVRRTGGPRGTPRIDGERATPAQKETGDEIHLFGIHRARKIRRDDRGRATRSARRML